MMNNFIRKIFVFCVVPLIFILLMDGFLRNKKSLSSEKYEGLLNKKDSIQVLFLGNSHAAYAIDPCNFKDFNVYNLANVRQSIYFDKRLTIKSIDKGVTGLKYVFISIDYHSLYFSSQGIRDIWTFYSNGIKYKNKNYTKAIISPFIWGYTPKVSFSMLKQTIISKIKYRNISTIDFNVAHGVNIRKPLCNGYIGYTGSNKSSFNDLAFAKRMESFSENINTSERKEVLEDLESFITFLKKNKIEPILFSSPTYSKYNEYSEKSILIKNKNNINDLSNKFDIQYWRYTESDKFLKEDFYNQDHLNEKGAEKFSKMLNARLKKYNESKIKKYVQEQH